MRALVPYNFLSEFASGEVLLSPTSTYFATLLNNTSAITDSDAELNWYNLNQVNLYQVATGGKTLPNPHLVNDQIDPNYVIFTADSVTWTSATFTTDAAVISDINERIITIYRYDPQILSNDSLTLNFNQLNGIIRINNNQLSLVAHNHVISDVIGLQDALDSKTDYATYSSGINNLTTAVSGLTSAFDYHTIQSHFGVTSATPLSGQVMAWNSSANQWQYASVDVQGTISHSSLLNLSADDHTQYLTSARGSVLFAPVIHIHSQDQITSASGWITDSLNSKQNSIPTSGSNTFYAGDHSFKVIDYSTIANIPATFTPSAHTQDISTINGLQTILANKEPSISTGTIAQYYRGDKSWQTLDKSAVGLGNVDNTTDLLKPLSNATTAALATKEPTVSSGTSGQFYRGDKTWQIPATSSLSDVASNAASHGQVLTYTSATNKYVPTTPSGGSITSGNLSETGSSVLTITSGTGAVLGSGTTIQVKQATSAQNGFLTSADYNSFNGRITSANPVLNFNTTAAPTYAEGNVFWDSINHCLAFQSDSSASTMQIGQELWVRVYNRTGSTIPNGSVVIINTATGNLPVVTLALASSEALSEGVLGLATMDIPTGSGSNGWGYITVFGVVNDVNTSNLAEGQNFYLSTTTSGAVTSAVPVAPNHRVTLGKCLVSHNTQGKLFININEGTELGELHDVFTSALSNNQILLYSSATNRWENTNLNASIITQGILPVQFGGTGQASFTPNALIYANSTTATNSIIPYAGVDKRFLNTNNSGTPVYSVLDTSDIQTGTLPVVRGGTGKTSATQFSIPFAATSSTVGEVSPNSSTSPMFLKMTGTGASGQNPLWQQVGVSDISSTGAPSSATYLRGDGTWATPATSGGTSAINAKQYGTFNITSGTSGTSGITFGGATLSIPYLIQFFDLNNDSPQYFPFASIATSGFSVSWDKPTSSRTITWVAIDGSYLSSGAYTKISRRSTSAVTVNSTDVVITFYGFSSNISQTLPAPVGSNRELTITNDSTGSNIITLTPSSGTIGGDSSISLYSKESITIFDSASGIWEVH